MSELPEYIQLLKNGDRLAFNELVEKYQHKVFNTVLSITQQNQDVEDICQEVFLQIFKSIKDFRGDSKLSTWIYRVSLSKAFEFERKKKAQKRINYFKNVIGFEINEIQVPDFNHPGVTLHNKEKAAILFKALKKLPDNQRLAFTLIKAEGLSYEEVGEIMNKSLKSIEGLIQRAKENLRTILKPYYSK